jgi:hypothetical protein
MRKSATGQVTKYLEFHPSAGTGAVVTLLVDRAVPHVPGVEIELSWEEPEIHDCNPTDGWHCHKVFDKWRMERDSDGSFFMPFSVTHCPFCGVKLP